MSSVTQTITKNSKRGRPAKPELSNQYTCNCCNSQVSCAHWGMHSKTQRHQTLAEEYVGEIRTRLMKADLGDQSDGSSESVTQVEDKPTLTYSIKKSQFLTKGNYPAVEIQGSKFLFGDSKFKDQNFSFELSAKQYQGLKNLENDCIKDLFVQFPELATGRLKVNSALKAADKYPPNIRVKYYGEDLTSAKMGDLYSLTITPSWYRGAMMAGVSFTLHHMVNTGHQERKPALCFLP